MAKGRKKSSSEFFEERLSFFFKNGASLRKICPDCVDEYNDHSVKKLISITYWLGIFCPIVNRNFREKRGWKIAYVDSMAGSGVTSTKKGNYFCGSCPGAVLHSSDIGYPFDSIYAAEIINEKADALEQRVSTIIDASKLNVYPNDIKDVSNTIANELENNTISFVVIDPEAFDGMTWTGISPLLSCKGDAMITWFESEAWRVKQAAVSNKHIGAEGLKKRFNELFGNETWMDARSPTELTDLFTKRIIEECGKTCESRVKIIKTDGGYYLMILFPGNFPNAQKLANDWKSYLENYFSSPQCREISKLLDVIAGRTKSITDFM